MTVREIIKKVDIYNEVANATGRKQIELFVEIGTSIFKFKTYKEFKTYITDMFCDFMANPILKSNCYELDDYNHIEGFDPLFNEKIYEHLYIGATEIR